LSILQRTLVISESKEKGDHADEQTKYNSSKPDKENFKIEKACWPKCRCRCLYSLYSEYLRQRSTHRQTDETTSENEKERKQKAFQGSRTDRHECSPLDEYKYEGF